MKPLGLEPGGLWSAILHSAFLLLPSSYRGLRLRQVFNHRQHTLVAISRQAAQLAKASSTASHKAIWRQHRDAPLPPLLLGLLGLLLPPPPDCVILRP